MAVKLLLFIWHSLSDPSLWASVVQCCIFLYCNSFKDATYVLHISNLLATWVALIVGQKLKYKFCKIIKKYKH